MALVRVGDTIIIHAHAVDASGAAINDLTATGYLYNEDNILKENAFTLTPLGSLGLYYYIATAGSTTFHYDNIGAWYGAVVFTGGSATPKDPIVPFEIRVDYSLSSFANAIKDIIAGAVWQVATSSLTLIDTVGKLIVDYLNAAITSRASAADYTSVRAAKLDNLDAAISSLPTAAEITDAVCDEPLTGATHNVPTSLGRRIRTIGDALAGTVDDPAPTAGSFITDLPSSVDNFYEDQTVYFQSGALAGQVRPIDTYDGATKTLTFEEPFTSAPANGDAFDVLPTHTHSEAHIAEAVWDSATRTLTSYGTLVADIVAALIASASFIATVAAGVWSYATRTLTSLSGLLSSGMVVSSGSAIGKDIPIFQGDAYTDGSPNGLVTLTDSGLGDLSGLTLKVSVRRCLTSGADFTLSSGVVGGLNTLSFPLTAAQTAAFQVRRAETFPLVVEVTDTGKETTKVVGTLTVTRSRA